MNNSFKINTATHKAAVQKIQVAEKLMKKVSITHEQWAKILFEMGCVFVERHVSTYYFQTALLQNKELGYWDWWFMLFIEDDASLLNYPSITNIERYIKEKERLLTLMESIKQFEHFLNINTRLSEKV
jgi:hypothetical protein